MNPKETLKKPQRNLQKPYERIYSEVPVGRSARAAGIYIYTPWYTQFLNNTTLVFFQQHTACKPLLGNLQPFCDKSLAYIRADMFFQWT